MKNLLKVSYASLVLTGILLGCNNNENDTSSSDANQSSENDTDVVEENELETEDESNESDSETNTGLTEKKDLDENIDDNKNDESEPNLGDGDTEDQVNLSVGEKAIIGTTISKFEVTVDKVEFTEELEGETVQSQFDTFLLLDVTIKNLSEDKLDIADSLGIFEITNDIDFSGYSERSSDYGAVDTFSGELEFNEELSGQLLYEDIEGEEHFLRETPGLISSSSVKNEATWIFSE